MSEQDKTKEWLAIESLIKAGVQFVVKKVACDCTIRLCRGEWFVDYMCCRHRHADTRLIL